MAEAISVDVPAGGLIYRDGDPPRCVLVVSGLVRISMTAPMGREITVRYGRCGDLLGTIVVVGGPAPVSAQMVTDVTLLVVNAGTLMELARTEPAVGWVIAQDIARRLYETLDVLADHAFGSLRQRVARHLLDLAASQATGDHLVAPVTQQALADAVGSVRPAVARILAHLRSEGLIESTAGGVRVLDAARLFDASFPRHR